MAGLLWAVGCEYDYGQDGNVFSTREKAEAFMRNSIQTVEGDDPDYSYDRLDSLNLIWYDRIVLDGGDT